MKKIILPLLAALTALVSVSCSKESTLEQASAIRVNITVSDLPAGTRAIKQGWKNGDVINIWFDKHQTKDPDLVLTLRDGVWTPSEIRDEIADELKEKGRLKFFWEGSNSWDSWGLAFPTLPTLNHSFKPASGKGFPLVLIQSDNQSNDAYYFDKATNTLTANLTWQYYTNIQVVVEGITPEDGYTMTVSGGVYTPYCITISEDNAVVDTGNVPVLGVANEENTTAFSLVVVSPGERDITFTLTSPGKKQYSYSVKRTFDFAIGQGLRHFYAARLRWSDFQEL